MHDATGANYDVSGTLHSTLRVEGTFAYPRLRDALRCSRCATATSRFRASRARSTPTVIRWACAAARSISQKGRALFTALVPIRVTGSGVAAAGGGPITGSIAAQDVELSNFAAMLPKGTQLAGRIDGNVDASGTLANPQIGGSADAARRNLQRPDGEIADHRDHRRARPRRIAGAAAVARRGRRRSVDGKRNRDARRPSPSRRAGVLDGCRGAERASRPAVVLYGEPQRRRHGGRATGAPPPRASGSVAVSNARIPLNAFLNVKGGGQSGPALPEVAFANLSITAGPNVRVQSANVDIGATGTATLGGTLRAPTLAGSLTSTGGTLSFYRTFNLESGSVTFDPTSGLIPDVDAAATTYVSDPPTAIRLHVTGPATNMNLALASDPSYNREQILGLLVGAQQFGAVRGVADDGQSELLRRLGARQRRPRSAQHALHAQPARSRSQARSPARSDSRRSRSRPTSRPGSGISAGKSLGKNMRAIFSETFGYPKTQAVTLEAYPDSASGAKFTWYTSRGRRCWRCRGRSPSAWTCSTSTATRSCRR